MGGPAPPVEPAATTAGSRAADLRRLVAVASETGLQVQIETLPQSNLTLIHLVNSATGYVVGEFPPEGVAQALAELEARAANHSGPPALDHHV